MRGELDWIVMKALEKDRARRYETANGFALDVERYLRNEVVEAGFEGREGVFGTEAAGSTMTGDVECGEVGGFRRGCCALFG